MAAFSFIEGLSFRELNEWVEFHTVIDTVDTETTAKAKVNPVVDLPYWTRGSVGFTITEPTDFTTIDDNQWRNWYFVWKGFTYFWNQVARLPGKQLLFVHAISPSFSTIATDLLGLPAYVNYIDAIAGGLSAGMPFWTLAGSDTHAEGALQRVPVAATATFSVVPYGLGRVDTFASDAEAMAAGFASRDAYWSAPGHDTHPPDSLVRLP